MSGQCPISGKYNLPPSAPVQLPCFGKSNADHAVLTNLSRAALRAMVRGGLRPDEPLVIHQCRRCRKYHVVLAGDVHAYGEERRKAEGTPSTA
jgi:hypothetical protein